MSIITNIDLVKQQIAVCEQRYGRKAGAVRLLAVTKMQPVEKMLAAYEAGLYCFGENYLQEALPKIAALADKNIEWHFIGSIQRNKTRKIAEHFAWVQSVDDFTIATRLNDQRPAHLPPLNICLEVNISRELSKSGILPAAAMALATQCMPLPRLKLRGLMTVIAPHQNSEQQRAAFHELAQCYQQLISQGLPLDTLSMGMSDDFEAAIAEGSTMVRVGSAIFGLRV